MGGMNSSGGFLGQNQPTGITNNYYDSPPDAALGDSNFDNSGDTLLADNDVNSTDFYQDQDMDFSGGDDSSFG